MSGVLLVAGTVLAAALLITHQRYFHRPGTPHGAWWALVEPGLRQLASLAEAGVLAAIGLLALYSELAAAVVLLAADIAYAAVMIIRRASARVPEVKP